MFKKSFLAMKTQPFYRVQWPLILGSLLVLFFTGCNQRSATQEYDDRLFYNGLLRKSVVYHNNKDKRRQQQFMDSAYASLKSVSTFGRLIWLNDKASFYYTEGRYDSCIYYTDQALKLVDREPTKDSYAEVYFVPLLYRGLAYSAMHQYDNAYDCLYKARQQVEYYHIRPCVASDYDYHIAMVLYQQKKYDQAAGFFKQSYLGAQEDCDSAGAYGIQERISNVALCYTKTRRYDSALKYYSLGIEFINEHIVPGENNVRMNNAQSELGVIYGNMGDVMRALQKTDSAVYLYKESIAINTKPRYENKDAQLTQAKLADLYLSRGETKKAFVVLQQLQQSLDTLANPQAKLMLEKNAQNYYEQVGQPALAYTHFRNYITLRDSLADADKKLLQIDMNQQMTDREQKYRISLLQSDNRFNRLYLAITLGFSAMVVLVLVLLFVNFRRSKSNVRKLTSLNNQVNEQKGQLEFAMQQLEKNMKDKDRILHVVAHDLRSPIGGIAAVSETLLFKDDGDDPEQHDKMVRMIQTASKHSLDLITELLQMNDRVEEKNELADINTLINQAVSFVKHKAAEKHQVIQVNSSPGTIIVAVNAEKIKRVIQNLLDNAIKFSYQDATIELTVKQEKGRVHIIIQDHGIGIPEDIGDSMFDAFSTARRKGTKGEKSFGLGLSVCRQIMEAHGGNIWFRSKEEEGTAFFLDLPVKDLRNNV